MPKKRILLYAPWFSPGFKAGGIIAAIVNFVEAMQQDYDIWIITLDRDIGDRHPYEDVKTDIWLTYSQFAKIMYLSKRQLGFFSLLKLTKSLQPDFLYLNGMFALHFTIYPLILNFLGLVDARVILCPHGMLQSGALQFKKRKKAIFLYLLRQVRFHRHVTFQATSREELSDIRGVFDNDIRVIQAEYFISAPEARLIPVNKKVNEVKLFYLSRISPKKNLKFALSLLRDIPDHIKVDFSIYGPIEDEYYWRDCQVIIERLPDNIKVNALGSCSPAEVKDEILRNHLFFLPTHGENFGYVIYESLACGRPVLISDKTPWQKLENENAGWSYALENEEAFKNTILNLARMDQDAFDLSCQEAYRYAQRFYKSQDMKTAYMRLFA